jgi:hypothetical protein
MEDELRTLRVDEKEYNYPVSTFITAEDRVFCVGFIQELSREYKIDVDIPFVMMNILDRVSEKTTIMNLKLDAFVSVNIAMKVNCRLTLQVSTIIKKHFPSSNINDVIAEEKRICEILNWRFQILDPTYFVYKYSHMFDVPNLGEISFFYAELSLFFEDFAHLSPSLLGLTCLICGLFVLRKKVHFSAFKEHTNFKPGDLVCEKLHMKLVENRTKDFMALLISKYSSKEHNCVYEIIKRSC